MHGLFFNIFQNNASLIMTISNNCMYVIILTGKMCRVSKRATDVEDDVTFPKPNAEWEQCRKNLLAITNTVHSGLINFFSYHYTCLVIFVNLCPFSQSCSPCLPFPLTSYCLAVVEQLSEGKEKYQSIIKNWFMLSGRISSFLRYLKKFSWLIFGGQRHVFIIYAMR